MMSIKKMILIALSLLIFNACSGLLNNEKKGHFTSKVNLNDFKLNRTLTQDMINFIQDYYSNSKTTFYFHLDTSAYNQGVAIENSLRNVGYGVSYIKKKGRIPFAYKIDFINKEVIRATYNIGSSTLSRLYKVNGKQTIPSSPFTIRGFKKRIDSKKYISSEYKDYKKAIVTIPVLNIRDRPSDDGKIIGKYKKNSLLFVESSIVNNKGETWSKVIQKDSNNNPIYSNKYTEYISSKYIKYLD